MPAGEPDFCDGKFALTLYIAVTPSNFGNRAGVETDAKGTLRQLNSRLESLIGISLFLRRKSKIPQHFRFSAQKMPNSLRHFAFSTRKPPKSVRHFPFSAQKMPNSAQHFRLSAQHFRFSVRKMRNAVQPTSSRV